MTAILPDIINHIYLMLFCLYVVVETLLLFASLKEANSTNGKIPEFLTDHIDEDTFKRSVDYSSCKIKFAIFSHVYSAIVLLFILFSGIFSESLTVWNHFIGEGYTASVVYILVLGLVFDLFSWPLQLYMTFKIEEHFGFNKMSFKLWLSDKIKGYIIGGILMTLMLYSIFWFVDTAGKYWWLIAASFVILFNLIVAYIYPIWIAPLFNKFSPLKNEKLKTEILELAKRLNFKLADVYEMDGSKRSGHANAYFTGFGKNKRVVLFDTLCELLQEKELLAVLSHEIGHMKKKHILKNMILSCFLMVLMFWFMDYIMNYKEPFLAFGFAQPSVAAVLAFMIFISEPVFYFISPLFSILSRHFEYQADAFAVKACGNSEDLTTALIALSKKSLSNYLPHPLYTFFHYSHPALRERLAALKKISIKEIDANV